MTRRILSGALIAGLAAGLLVAALTIVALVPLILEAETFEAVAGAATEAAAHGRGAGAAPHAGEAAGATLGRHGGTVAMTVVAYAGFALVLGAAMAIAARAGLAPTARRGALWGLAGFAAVHLAPAAGLAPELPGAVAADLALRQVWWVLCVAATAAGLATLAFGRGPVPLLLGAGLVLLPHLVGAPQPPSHAGPVPPGLAAAFVGRSLGVAALGWVALGTVLGALSDRSPARAVA